MPAAELAEWIAYFEIHPMPDPTWDAAQICSVIANVNRARGGRAFRASDFVPRTAGGPGQSTEDMMAVYFAGA